MISMGALPLLSVDFRSRVSSLATVSDASESGDGVF